MLRYIQRERPRSRFARANDRAWLAPKGPTTAQGVVPSLAGQKARNPDAYDKDGLLIPFCRARPAGATSATQSALSDLFGGGVGWGHRAELCDPLDVAARLSIIQPTY